MQRAVSLTFGFAHVSCCWRIFTVHAVLVQVNRGTRIRSRVGCPTTGRSTSCRIRWSRSRPSSPQAVHDGSTVAGRQVIHVWCSSIAAPVIVRPSSTVRMMVSATRDVEHRSSGRKMVVW